MKRTIDYDDLMKFLDSMEDESMDNQEEIENWDDTYKEVR